MWVNRAILRIFRMSGVHPIASLKADIKNFGWERPPGDIAYDPNRVARAHIG